MFDWSNASEQDVREELIAPLLAKLGYARGSLNDIVREQTLRYSSIALGRRKKSDPPLLGRADYVLKVLGETRWVIEAKPPNESISEESVAQTLSYARHPEISGVYAVVCNGHRLEVYGITQMSTDDPLLSFEIESLEQAYLALAGTLAPEVVRREFRRPKLSTERSLGPGLKSAEKISGGLVRSLHVSWSTSEPVSEVEAAELTDIATFLGEYQSNILDGELHRTNEGTIVARFRFSTPHPLLHETAERKGLFNVNYVCLGPELSRDPEMPSLFDYVYEVKYDAGEEIYDLKEWKTTIVEMPANVSNRGQAMGVLQENVFLGFFNSEYLFTVDDGAGFLLTVHVEGSFEFYLAD